jgi:hypothetical protein
MWPFYKDIQCLLVLYDISFRPAMEHVQVIFDAAQPTRVTATGIGALPLSASGHCCPVQRAKLTEKVRAKSGKDILCIYIILYI